MRKGFLFALLFPMASSLLGCPSLDGFAGGDGGAGDGDASLPTNGFVSLDEAVKFCSMAFACPNLGKSTLTSLHVPIDSQNFSACVAWLAGAVPPDRPGTTLTAKALGCAADAQSCNTADACMWFEFVPSNDPRCVGFTGGQNGACSPNLTSTYQCAFDFIVHCDNPFNYSGSTCLQSSMGPYFCAVSSGLCSNPDAGTAASCQGSFYTYCEGGLLVGYDCGVQGMTCTPTGCATNGTVETCGALGSATCNGDKIAVCDGLARSELSCDALGGTCDGTGTVPRCATAVDTCSPYDGTVNACTGDTISLCVDGRPLSFDCSSVGLTCVDGNGTTSSHCQ